MLVLLRDVQSKLYYGGQGKWTSDPTVAVGFGTIEEALLRNRQEHLEHMEVVFQHSAEGGRRILPIGHGPWHNQRWSFF